MNRYKIIHESNKTASAIYKDASKSFCFTLLSVRKLMILLKESKTNIYTHTISKCAKISGNNPIKIVTNKSVKSFCCVKLFFFMIKSIINNENSNKNTIGTSNVSISKPNALSLENKYITKYTNINIVHSIKFIGLDLLKTLVIILGFYIFVV